MVDRRERSISISVCAVAGLLLAVLAGAYAVRHNSPPAATTPAGAGSDGAAPAGIEARPARILDTALGKYWLRQFPLFPHYRTKAYGPNWAGGIKAIRGGVIAVNAAGEFLYFDTQSHAVQRLSIHYENNREDFLAYMRPEQSPWPHNFRFFDIAVRDGSNNELLLLASLVYWHSDRQCYTFRIVSLNVASLQALRSGDHDTEDWNLVFETEPCMRPSKTSGWFGHEGGGALAVDGDDLYVGIGHFGLYGADEQPMVSQDPKSMYGRIYHIDLKTGRHTVLSNGHRNPSGLLFIDGDIWEAEHGPQGGDELNLIRRGANYGWPKVTLGTQYGLEEWPFSELFNNGKKTPVGRHSGYAEPIYAWVPSIGISTLARITGFTPQWEGDFLAGGLADRSLHRLRLVEGHVQYDEPIRIGSRIRDISQSDGPVYVLTDDAVLMELRLREEEEAAPDEGPTARYMQMPGWTEARTVLERCRACHSFEKGVENGAAPNLYGIVDRPVGATAFPNYSAEWLALKGSWTEQRLDQLLAKSTSVAPRGSVMAGQAYIQDPDVRAAILAYLRSNADRP